MCVFVSECVGLSVCVCVKEEGSLTYHAVRLLVSIGWALGKDAWNRLGKYHGRPALYHHDFGIPLRHLCSKASFRQIFVVSSGSRLLLIVTRLIFERFL